MKLHVHLDHPGGLPCWALVTDGDTTDVRIAQPLTFAPGPIVVIDRGYLDDALYHRWTRPAIGFVTRPRPTMLDEVLEHRPVPTRGPVRGDEMIRPTRSHAADRCPIPLRQVSIWDEQHQRRLTCLTNLRHLAASTIAAIYTERWQSELLFKAFKQHLKIKTFVGASENAVQVQLWIALLAMWLLKLLQLKSTWPWSLSTLAALLRFNLLTYRDRWTWLDAPFERPLAMPTPTQARLFAS